MRHLAPLVAALFCIAGGLRGFRDRDILTHKSGTLFRIEEFL
jgi:hypothetical protein